jgi:hypothetical protein
MGTPFDPKEVIFAPTARCNLSCGHCRVNRDSVPNDRESVPNDRESVSNDRAAASDGALDAAVAVAFLEDCAAGGIDRVGFSGGEPFLETAFLSAIIAKALELDMYFDRLMTNGLWWRDEDELERSLAAVLDAGFDGTIAVSVDGWHDLDATKDGERLATFIRAVGKIAHRYDMLELVSVTAKDGSLSLGILESIASALGKSPSASHGAKLVMSGKRPSCIRDAAWSRSAGAGMDDGSGINIPITVIEYSPGADERDAWASERWFTDDWCAGPGNVLYVHPDGQVAVCCGFANGRSELIAGHIGDGCQSLIERARTLPHVRRCYEQGLAFWRKEREAAGATFPGKASDICFFCDWVCAHPDGK